MEKIRFQKNSDEMMRVISEQKKSLYLKAYVGSVYKDGVWRKMPEGQDPLQWFLTTSRTGNQMLYASAAVEAFRAHGIPARYVEGYYLGASKIQDSKNGEVSITGENAHAWVEVYFDGVGWKAVDVTPGYYYNVATLLKMVNTPEQIKKNAAMSMSAGEIGVHFDMTGVTISYHLKILKKAELIFEKKEKNYIYYTLNTSVVEEVMLWLSELKGGNHDVKEE